MRLTAFTDYTLRTLIYLAQNQQRLVTITDIAEGHAISKNHLMKVVHQLGQNGIIDTVRGRHGGIRLKLAPAQINVGAIVRQSENDFFMAECFNREHNTCSYAPGCSLKKLLGTATAAYLNVLDGVTLADLKVRSQAGSVVRLDSSAAASSPAGEVLADQSKPVILRKNTAKNPVKTD